MSVKINSCLNRLIIRSLILILFILQIINIYAIGDKHYEIDKRVILQEGLSQSRILSILEDERGFMWFGTADGLNRYDGYTFKIFRNKFNDSTSLPNNVINSMVEDDNGNIWCGTNNGIAIFNPYTETFISIRETDSVKIALGANLINSCVIDKQMNIWYSTNGYGVFKINSKSLERENYFFSEIDSLYLNEITTLFIDKNNRLWIGNFIKNAILAYNINKGQLEKFVIHNIPLTGKKRLKLHSFFEDNKSRIWLSIVDYNDLQGSLFYLDKDKKTFSNFKQFLSKDCINTFYDSFNSIVSITQDKDDNILFASLLSGIFKFKFGNTPIAYYVQSPIKDARINCIYKSTNGILWIGTNGNGIEISIPDNTEFKLMSNKINSDFSIESIRTFAEDDNYYWIGGYYGLSKIKKDFSKAVTVDYASVYSIANCTNNSNLMWTGSEGGGLQPINKKNNKLTPAIFKSNIVNQQLLGFIFVIYPVVDTLVLLGTMEGLFGYNPISKAITSYPYYRPTLKNQTYKTVRTIYKDRFGNILIGFVQGGIGKLFLNKRRVEKFRILPDLQPNYNYNPINSIYNDKKNNYWIATSNGLIKYATKDKTIKHFTEADGLPNSHIYGILPDDEDNLWMSTNNGISCYYPNERVFRNYDMSDGLQNNEFNTGAYFRASDNTLFFGGISGFNYFNPKKIKQNSIIPELVITGIKISNKYLKISKEELSKHTFTIQPDEEIFTIEFAGLSFINSNKNQYKYKILELNKNWIKLGNQHQITFNNMTPGSYTLEILASNNHGLWLKKSCICTIVVLPTFYESILFKWILLIVIILIIIAVYRIRLKQITRQKNRLKIFADQQTASLLVTNETLKDEILKHKATTNELEASNKTKDKFISIMAHDIINPLGVILGFSDLLIDETNDFDEEDKFSFIKTMNNTAKSLTALLSNLLQWSRLQNDTIIPKPQEILLLNSVKETVTLLQGNITEKEINLIININEKTKIIADGNMLSTILRNLLSNAVKFTPVKGDISINAKNDNKMVEISIIDDGVGIPEKNMNKLLNPDENITTKGTNNESGTGLGLSLVYEFVIMNKGKIWIESEVGKGTTFYFTLPSSS